MTWDMARTGFNWLWELVAATVESKPQCGALNHRGEIETAIQELDSENAHLEATV